MDSLDPISAADLLYRHRSLPAFLQAYHRRKKQSNKRWSFEVWARRLRISKPTLVRVVSGSRPATPKIEKSLEQYFNFDQEERGYLRLISLQAQLDLLYPELSIRVPQIELVKKRREHRHTPSASLEVLHCILQPEVGWLLTALEGKGMDVVNDQRFLDWFHDGIPRELLQHGLAEAKKFGIISPSESGNSYEMKSTIHLDEDIIGPAAGRQREIKILELLRSMACKDLEVGRAPKVNNRSSTFRMNSGSLPQLLQVTARFVIETVMSQFGRPDGDLLVNVEAFVAEIARIGP